jgi:biotin carboxyl carrier protein
MSRVALALVCAFCLVLGACSQEGDSGQLTGGAAMTPPAATSPGPTTATPPTPKARVVTEQEWTPFASVGGVTLRHPSRRVERVGFHQSNHEGARELRVVATAVAPATLETRDRLTAARTAADVVSDPKVEIRAPVTGRVKRAGTYVLYCKHSDDYLVIEPDAHPGWEVKLLHIDGVGVSAGDRVTAGQTVVAPGPTRLPFESQVDELSEGDAWPHVHIEVVDQSIPNKPSPGSGC